MYTMESPEPCTLWTVQRHVHYGQSRYSMDTDSPERQYIMGSPGTWTLERHVHYGHSRDMYTRDSQETWTLRTAKRHGHYGQSRYMCTMDSPDSWTLWTVRRHVNYGQSRDMLTMDSPETCKLWTVQRHVHSGRHFKKIWKVARREENNALKLSCNIVHISSPSRKVFSLGSPTTACSR